MGNCTKSATKDATEPTMEQRNEEKDFSVKISDNLHEKAREVCTDESYAMFKKTFLSPGTKGDHVLKAITFGPEPTDYTEEESPVR